MDYKDKALDILYKAQVYIVFYASAFAEASIWAYHYLRLRYLAWLDLSGMCQVGDVTCVYYTYNGERYMFPVPKRRGPLKQRYRDLESYFKNQPETMLALMGPNNDWHGQGTVLEGMLGFYDSTEEETSVESVHSEPDVAPVEVKEVKNPFFPPTFKKSGEIFDRGNEL